MGCMKFQEYILDYAREEASYLRTRTDMRTSNGPRSAAEGYANLVSIQWKTGDRLDGFEFTYSDGLSRRWGNATDWTGGHELNVDNGEFLHHVKYWDTEKRRPGKGMRFVTQDNDEEFTDVDALGSKCSKMFGGIHKSDETLEPEGKILDIVYGDADEWTNPEAVAQIRECPEGSWLEAPELGDDPQWRFEGAQLVVLDKERGVEIRFLPLPHETLKIEHGQIVVEQRLMG